MIFSKASALTIFQISASSVEKIFLLRESISDFATILLKMSRIKPAVISAPAEDMMKNAKTIPSGRHITEHIRHTMHAI